jgi:hypothetical protein
MRNVCSCCFVIPITSSTCSFYELGDDGQILRRRLTHGEMWDIPRGDFRVHRSITVRRVAKCSYRHVLGMSRALEAQAQEIVRIAYAWSRQSTGLQRGVAKAGT